MLPVHARHPDRRTRKRQRCNQHNDGKQHARIAETEPKQSHYHPNNRRHRQQNRNHRLKQRHRRLKTARYQPRRQSRRQRNRNPHHRPPHSDRQSRSKGSR